VRKGQNPLVSNYYMIGTEAAQKL